MYNGWKNYETWNIALWISNDEELYNMAREFKGADDPYESFVKIMREIGNEKINIETPDGVAWNDTGLDYERLDEMMEEL